jgi:hypothetical protein
MTNIVQLLGEESEHLLNHRCIGIPKESLHLPGPDFVERVVAMKDRKPRVLRNLQSLYGTGRLANTGYLSLLPVDQGVEHSAGASFAPNPIYFDPENIVRLAIEGGCNGVASVVQLLDRRLDPLPDLGADGPGHVDHPRHRGDRHAGLPGDVADARGARPAPLFRTCPRRGGCHRF